MTGSGPASDPASHDAGHLIPLREATRAWFLISLQTFGGPAGQIAVMQRTLVDEKRWIGERRFMHALSYCMLLPGPEAQQLAVYTGWLLNGWAGGLVAGVLFVLPGVVAMLALSWAYVTHGDTAVVTGLFLGLAPAVVAIVVQAVVRIGSRALTRPRPGRGGGGRRSCCWPSCTSRSRSWFSAPGCWAGCCSGPDRRGRPRRDAVETTPPARPRRRPAPGRAVGAAQPR